jgi:hypothetical protein
MNLIQKLPIEIQLKILSYTYKPQPNLLQNDIIHYVTSLNRIKNICKFNWDNLLINDYFSLELLETYILFYANGYIHIIKEFNSLLHDILLRHKYFTNIKKLNNWYNNKVFFYNKKNNIINVCRNINFIWGLLQIKEREIFLKAYIIPPYFNDERVYS